MRKVYQDNGYQEVKAPQILDRSLWERSGHWQNFKENMFTTESEKRDFAVKPMNCPGHILIFNSDLRSYRDLPLRYGEFGQCHRNEPSGALHGIMRVRGFTQDDGHIFCTEDDIQDECVAFNKLALNVYRDFGFSDITIKLALRPEQRLGDDATWDRAEERAAQRVARVRRRVDRATRRRRVLRPQDRISPQGLARAVVAVRHHAGGLPDAGASRRRVRRGRRHAQDARDAAPRDRGLARALHRHPDRELRRRPAACGSRRGKAVVLNITDRTAAYAGADRRGASRRPVSALQRICATRK
jgi:hypothetical protein